MAENGHGGERTPANPAPVSGPGALSRRTDGGPGARQGRQDIPDAAFGEQADFQAIQAGSPMQGGGGALPPLVPLDAPSARPDEPVTSGAAVGPGLSPEAAGIASDEQGTLAQLTPLLRSLETIADLPNSTAQFRSFVRKLRSKASG